MCSGTTTAPINMPILPSNAMAKSLDCVHITMVAERVMLMARKLDSIIRLMKKRGILPLIGLLCLCVLVSRNTAQVANVLITYEARGEANDDIWVTNLTGTIRYNLTQNQS